MDVYLRTGIAHSLLTYLGKCDLPDRDPPTMGKPVEVFLKGEGLSIKKLVFYYGYDPLKSCWYLMTDNADDARHLPGFVSQQEYADAVAEVGKRLDQIIAKQEEEETKGGSGMSKIFGVEQGAVYPGVAAMRREYEAANSRVNERDVERHLLDAKLERAVAAAEGDFFENAYRHYDLIKQRLEHYRNIRNYHCDIGWPNDGGTTRQFVHLISRELDGLLKSVEGDDTTDWEAKDGK